MRRGSGSGGALLLLALLAPAPALACACCTSPAWRHVEVEPLERRRHEIDQLRFSPDAKLALGEADEVEGIESYALTLARRPAAWVFTFRDPKGRTGALTLQLPKTISIFEVDPRDGMTDAGLGPTLYKEWKLTGPATSEGLFRRAVPPGQRLTLVLHGRGNACGGYEQFTAWTLLAHGKARGVTMYGGLVGAQ